MQEAWVLVLLAGCGGDDLAAADADGSGSETEAATTAASAEGETGSSATSTSGPSSQGTGDASSGSRTGGTGECGNGVLEASEECDDENTVSDDGCRADCTIPFEIAWTLSIDRSGGDSDLLRDVVVAGDGTIYALGTSKNEAGDFDVWLSSYDAEGQPGSLDVLFDGGATDDAVGLAMHPEGLAIVAESESEDSGADLWTLVVSPQREGAVVWSASHDGPATVEGGSSNLNDLAAGIVVDDEGRVFSFGHQSTDDQGFDLVVLAYSAEGEPLWTATHDGEGGNDYSDGIALHPDGSLWVLGSENSDVDPRAWVGLFDEEGNEIDARVFDLEPNALTLDGDGNLLLAGRTPNRVAGHDVEIRKYDPNFDELWRYRFVTQTSGNDRVRDVRTDEAGHVYLTGSRSRVGEQTNVWSMRLDSTGAPLWGSEYGNEAVALGDAGSAVWVIEESQDVLVAGTETVLGEQTNGWLRRHVQL